MKVALDIRMIFHSGIGTYLRGLLGDYAENETAGSFEFTLVHETHATSSITIPEKARTIAFHAPVYSIREQIRYPVSRIGHVDVLHYPHYAIPLRWKRPMVVNIHDLNHLEFPEYLPTLMHRAYARYFFNAVAKRADRIIVPTNFIKGRVIDLLGVGEELVRIIPYAAPDYFSPISEATAADDRSVLEKYGLKKPYLLTSGIYKPHKNYPFLLRAFALLHERLGDKTPALVMIGFRHGKNTVDLKHLIKELNLEPLVFLPGYVPQEDVPSVYRNAQSLVFPSLYEGFGLPVLEAMKSGVPVAASDIAPICEVAGKCVATFDPRDINTLVDTLERLVEDERFRKRLIQRGLERQRLYSWHEVAWSTFQVYKQVAGK